MEMMEIDFENGRISNFQRHRTLTLDWAIQHTVVHHSSTYVPNFIRIGYVFVDGRTYVRTDRHRGLVKEST